MAAFGVGARQTTTRVGQAGQPGWQGVALLSELEEVAAQLGAIAVAIDIQVEGRGEAVGCLHLWISTKPHEGHQGDHQAAGEWTTPTGRENGRAESSKEHWDLACIGGGAAHRAKLRRAVHVLRARPRGCSHLPLARVRGAVTAGWGIPRHSTAARPALATVPFSLEAACQLGDAMLAHPHPTLALHRGRHA